MTKENVIREIKINTVTIHNLVLTCTCHKRMTNKAKNRGKIYQTI